MLKACGPVFSKEPGKREGRFVAVPMEWLVYDEARGALMGLTRALDGVA